MYKIKFFDKLEILKEARDRNVTALNKSKGLTEEDKNISIMRINYLFSQEISSKKEKLYLLIDIYTDSMFLISIIGQIFIVFSSRKNILILALSVCALLELLLYKLFIAHLKLKKIGKLCKKLKGDDIDMIKKNISYLLLSMSLSVAISFSAEASPKDISVSNSTVFLHQNVKVDPVKEPDFPQQLEMQIEKKDNDIENTISSINSNYKKLDTLKENINDTQVSLKKLNSKLDTVNKKSATSIRNFYENNSNYTYLSVLISSNDINTLVENIYFISRLINYNHKIVNEIKGNQTTIQKNLNTLHLNKNQLEKVNKKMTKDVKVLNQQKNSEMKLLADLKQQINNENTTAVSNNYNKSNNTLTNNKKYTSRNVSKTISHDVPSLSRGTSSLNTNNDILNYAFSFLGVPYVWGGASPSGFDCSGLVQYVYKHFNIDLPRTSQEQQNYGVQILDRDNLKPGDLVFFGRPAYHVGIYIGNNKFLEAPHTGDVVKIATLYNYTSATRVN